jgi:putative membrane protein
MPTFTRCVPALGAALVIGIGGAGATAAAHGGHHRHGHRVSAWDEQYLQTAIEGDRFEIAGGRLAERKGSSAAVRAYGAKLVADHSASLADAAALARKLGIQVPVAPSPSMQWELQTVARFSGAQFDASYADLEAKDHQQDISEAEDEVSKGTNRKIRRSAAEELPMLREHLAIAEHLGGRQGIDPTP